MNSSLSLKLILALLCAALVAWSPAIAQSIKGMPRETRGGTMPSKLPGATEADRWNKVKEIIPKIIGMSKHAVMQSLGASTSQSPEGAKGIYWTYQITDWAKNPAKAEYLCLLLCVHFATDDRVTKCTVELLWGSHHQ